MTLLPRDREPPSPSAAHEQLHQTGFCSATQTRYLGKRMHREENTPLCEDTLFLTLSRRGKQAIRSSATECQASRRAQQVLRHSSAALPSSPGPRLATHPRGVTSALGEGCAASPATALEVAGPARGESPGPGSFHPAGTAPAPRALKQPQQGTGIWIY